MSHAYYKRIKYDAHLNCVKKSLSILNISLQKMRL